MADLIALSLGLGIILGMAAYAHVCERIWPMLDLIMGATASLGLLIYLVWALVRPEDF